MTVRTRQGLIDRAHQAKPWYGQEMVDLVDTIYSLESDSKKALQELTKKIVAAKPSDALVDSFSKLKGNGFLVNQSGAWVFDESVYLTQKDADARYSLKAHNHDNRYYTKTQIDDINSSFALKATLVVAGIGLTGGGDLSEDRTFNVNFDTNGHSQYVSRADHAHSLTLSGDIQGSGDVSGTIISEVIKIRTGSVPALSAGFLQWTGSSFIWAPATPITSYTLNDMSDVTLTTSLNNQLLKFDTSTGQWINWTPTFEQGLGNPSSNGWLLSSTTSGTRSWVAPYSHPTGDGNLHVPATSTTNNGKVLAAGSTAGALSWLALPTSMTPTAHALSHTAGNSDAIDGQSLAGLQHSSSPTFVSISAKLNAHSANETTIANGFASVSGGLWVNYGGAAQEILEYRFASGMANGIYAKVKAYSFVKNLGTSSQFLKADGSSDGNLYALNSSLANYLLLIGGELTGDLILPGFRFTPDLFAPSTYYCIYPRGVTPSASNYFITAALNGSYSGINSSTRNAISIGGVEKLIVTDTQTELKGNLKLQTGTGMLKSVYGVVTTASASDLPGGPYLPLVGNESVGGVISGQPSTGSFLNLNNEMTTVEGYSFQAKSSYNDFYGYVNTFHSQIYATVIRMGYNWDLNPTSININNSLDIDGLELTINAPCVIYNGHITNVAPQIFSSAAKINIPPTGLTMSEPSSPGKVLVVSGGTGPYNYFLTVSEITYYRDDYGARQTAYPGDRIPMQTNAGFLIGDNDGGWHLVSC